MRNGAANEPMPQPQQFTADDIHRQQRVNLMMRVLDLECEVALLQQEIQQLKNQIIGSASMDIEHRASLE